MGFLSQGLKLLVTISADGAQNFFNLQTSPTEHPLFLPPGDLTPKFLLKPRPPITIRARSSAVPIQHTLGFFPLPVPLMLTRQTSRTSFGSSNMPQPPTLNWHVTSSKRPTLIASGVSPASLLPQSLGSTPHQQTIPLSG